MTTVGLLVILGCLIWFIWALTIDMQLGLRVAAIVFVIMPQQVNVEFAGLPDLSIQRLMLVALLPFLPRFMGNSPSWRSVPFVFGLLALAGAELISVLFSTQMGASVKFFLSFTFEILLFYIVVALSLRSWGDVTGMIKAVCQGLVIVAVLATIERYTGHSIFEVLTGRQPRTEMEVTSTYPHRILLGYAMAMAIPLLLVLTDWAENRGQRFRSWLALFCVISACYFSTSRGPWLGAALSAGGMMVLTGRASIRKLAIILGLVIVVCVARPGVWQTISGLSNQTLEKDTLKGKSYDYRWRLWTVAYTEIGKSIVRTLFGYGGRSTESMDLSEYFEKESGGNTIATGFTSWDNNLACDLMEFGLTGFAIELLLYFTVMRRLLLNYRRAEGEPRFLLAAILGSAGVYLFALTNVYIFSPQLTYLFWILVAVGTVAARLQRESRAEQSVRPSSEDTAELGELSGAGAR